MDYDLLAQLGAVAGVAGSVLLLVARSRGVFLAGLAALAAAALGLGTALADGVSADRLTSPALAAAGVAGLITLGLCATVFVRWPAILIPVTAAVAPFRPPIDVDTGNRFLVAIATDGRVGRLLPLYFVLATAAAAAAVRVIRGEQVKRIPSELAYPAAAFTGLVGISLLWSHDLPVGTDLLLYFVFPMALLVALVGRAPVRPWLAKSLFLITVTIACVLAAIGLWQEYTKDLFFSTPRIEVGNIYAEFFRVTSLFNDPSLYGRHLVVGIAVVLVAMWAHRVHVGLSAALIALFFVGLFFSYSQSSMVALAVTTVAVVVVLGGRAARRTVLGATALLALIGATALAAAIQDQSLRRVTSDRSRRVAVTAEVFLTHPAAGVGIGGHPAASREIATRRLFKENFVSHTTPLTIAADLGLIGLIAYSALLAGAVVLLRRVRRVDEALGVGLGAVFLALFVHSLFYGGFFEDPIAWLVLATGSAVLIAARVAAPTVPEATKA